MCQNVLKRFKQALSQALNEDNLSVCLFYHIFPSLQPINNEALLVDLVFYLSRARNTQNVREELSFFWQFFYFVFYLTLEFRILLVCMPLFRINELVHIVNSVF